MYKCVCINVPISKHVSFTKNGFGHISFYKITWIKHHIILCFESKSIVWTKVIYKLMLVKLSCTQKLIYLLPIIVQHMHKFTLNSPLILGRKSLPLVLMYLKSVGAWSMIVKQNKQIFYNCFCFAKLHMYYTWFAL